MIGLAVPAPQATCDCFTFFWHVHLQSHLLTRTATHTHRRTLAHTAKLGTQSISKSTFKSHRRRRRRSRSRPRSCDPCPSPRPGWLSVNIFAACLLCTAFDNSFY